VPPGRVEEHLSPWDLESDWTAEPRVVGEVDDPVAAPAEFALDGEPPERPGGDALAVGRGVGRGPVRRRGRVVWSGTGPQLEQAGEALGHANPDALRKGGQVQVA